jgi:uncharacterized membrane protein
MSDHPLIARYLREFERALEIHDVPDGRDIAADLKGHIDEALASGKPIDATMESLGPADTLARAYAVELHMNKCREASLAMRLVKVGSILAASSCMTFFVATTLGLMALGLLAAGAIGMILTPIDLVVDIPQVEISGPPGMAPPLLGMAAMGVFLVIFAAGAAFGWLFWLYLRFLHRTLRKSLPRAWAWQPA